jgi:hypothetical protein
MVQSRSIVSAQTEPIGGEPPPSAGQSVSDLPAQLADQRASKPYCGQCPPSQFIGFASACCNSLGMADNAITAYSGPLHTFREVAEAARAIGAGCAGVVDQWYPGALKSHFSAASSDKIN